MRIGITTDADLARYAAIGRMTPAAGGPKNRAPVNPDEFPGDGAKESWIEGYLEQTADLRSKRE